MNEQVTPIVENGGQQPPQKSWIDELPEDIRGEPSLKVIKDVPTLAKSYVSAQRMVGAEKIAVPNPKYATPEEWQGVFKKLGLPESPDKYELKAPEGANPEFVGKFKQLAHKAGILPKQAAELLEWYQGETKASVEAVETQRKADVEKASEALKREWGANFDKELAVTESALNEWGDDELKGLLKETGLNNHPAVIRLLNKFGKTLGEDKIKGAGNGALGTSKAEVEARIESLRTEPAYLDGEHPKHNLIVNEVNQLYAKLYTT